MKIPELLAPAGSFESAEAAFVHGADAVYVGIGRFNLRAHAPNFTIADFRELMKMARGMQKRVFVALNTMPNDDMIAQLVHELELLQKASIGPDAFIISDPGVLTRCQRYFPQVPLHLSTQTGTFNAESLRFWEQQGISRVILPRELNCEQIRSLAAAKIVDIEVFIHGAMCVSVAGRCLLGAYLSHRHPNQGDCPQPCRFKYRITPVDDNERVGQLLEVEETKQGVYLLNSKDLCTIAILPEILETGVMSLKIEGRNKSAHYVSTVTKVYREALDSAAANPSKYSVIQTWIDELDAVDHRPYTTGFYGQEYSLQEVFQSKASAEYRLVGVVKDVLPTALPVIDVKNSFLAEEELVVLPVQQKVEPFSIVFSSLSDISGNKLEKATPNRLVVGMSNYRLRPGDMIRKKV
jgi:U32 family peptidase